MSVATLPARTALPLVPESAPFTAEQRAWLNGFLAGALGLQESRATLTPAVLGPPDEDRTEQADPAERSEPAATEEEFPWHDPALPLEERMALAEGKPLERRLMAAMAQLDCGACGYACKTYSEAIARGDERDLTKCSPGGRATAQKLKELLKARPIEPDALISPSAPLTAGLTAGKSSGNQQYAEAGANGNGKNHTSNGRLLFNSRPDSPLNGVDNGRIPGTLARTASPKIPADRPGYSRRQPVLARVSQVLRLNRPGSEKDTRQVVIDLGTTGLTYQPGDSLGVYPRNCSELVEKLLETLACHGEETVELDGGKATTVWNALTTECTISKICERTIELFAERAADPEQAEQLWKLREGKNSEWLDAADLLDLLRRFSSVRVSTEEIMATLPPLQPRLYSISSSLRAHPGEVHLTVGTVRYQALGRMRKGVCSTFLADRVEAGWEVPVFVQQSHGFRLPTSEDTPIVMIGPGTGIAPFRAFLAERAALGHRGRNWLFFGDQRSATDFLYEEELRRYQREGLLTRLDTAFSRDQPAKLYVQHRMKAQAAELWRWLRDGATVYVCGDAKRMAADVDLALREIIAEQGAHSPAEAKAYLQGLAKEKRYLRDVY